jgi:hypothetical protein
MSEEAAFDDMGETLFDVLGVDATFTPAAGDPVSLKVVFRNELAMQPVGYESRAWQGERSIEFILSDLAAEPNRGDRFEVDGNTYTVGAVTANDGRFCTVAVA